MTNQQIKEYLAPVRGIIEIIGEHDAGKTLAALGAVSPLSRLCFIDDDVKGDGTVRQLADAGIEIGQYISLAEKRAALDSRSPAQGFYLNVVIPMVESIQSNKYDVIVWDTWRTVYDSARAYVDNNRASFKGVKWMGNSTIINGIVSKIARQLEENLLLALKSKAKLVIVCHHMKDNYVQNIAVGRRPESSAVFDKVCSMRVILRHNSASPIPKMLFLKRLNQPRVVNGKIEFVNITPRKITPVPADKSIWDAIERYIADPVGTQPVRPDEIPDEYELSLMDGSLSGDQRESLKIMRDLSLLVDAAEHADDGVATRVRELRDTGLPPPAILAALSEEGVVVTLPEILKIQ